MIARKESEMTCVGCKEKDCGWRDKAFKAKCISDPNLPERYRNCNIKHIFTIGEVYNVFCGLIYGNNGVTMRATNIEDLNIDTLNKVKTSKFEFVEKLLPS